MLTENTVPAKHRFWSNDAPDAKSEQYAIVFNKYCGFVALSQHAEKIAKATLAFMQKTMVTWQGQAELMSELLKINQDDICTLLEDSYKLLGQRKILPAFEQKGASTKESDKHDKSRLSVIKELIKQPYSAETIKEKYINQIIGSYDEQNKAEAEKKYLNLLKNVNLNILLSLSSEIHKIKHDTIKDKLLLSVLK